MAADNTLGAPTEGLGQTVTFAANGRGSVPPAQAVQRQAIRNTSTGGGAQRTAEALQIQAPKGDTTFQVLARLGGDLIKPQLEAERAIKFAEGMQKAAQGQAIQEIVDEQPWYSKLFGPTSLVDGARAYTAATTASTLAADMENNMPELRKLSASEMAKHAADRMIGAANTGDQTTDAMITQQVSASLPLVLKSQAKAHLRYQQEMLETSIKGNVTAAASLLGAVDNAKRTGGTTESDDVLGAGLKFLDTFTAPEGMDPVLHDKILGEGIAGSLVDGNFAAYRFLETSGKLAKMDPQVAYNLRRTYRQASDDAKLKLPYEFAVKLADFEVLANKEGTTDAKIIEAATKINADYQQATGDFGNLLAPAQTVTEMRQLRMAEQQRLDALARKRDAAETKEDKDALKIAVISGRAASAVSNPGYIMTSLSGSEQQEVFDHIRMTADPKTRLSVIVNQAGRATDKVEKDQINAEISSALRTGSPDALYAVYVNRYAPLVAASGDLGEAVAASYAGEHKDIMAKYHSLAQGRQLDALQQGVFYGESTRPVPKAGTGKRFTEIVNKLSDGVVMGIVKSIGVADMAPMADPEGLAAILAPRMSTVLPVAEAIEEAKISMPDLTMAGGYHWVKGTQDTKLEAWFDKNLTKGGVARDNINRSVKHSIDKYAEASGIDGPIKVGQTADSADGIPRLYVMGMGSDNKVKLLTFTAKDISDNWIAKQAADAVPLNKLPPSPVEASARPNIGGSARNKLMNMK